MGELAATAAAQQQHSHGLCRPDHMSDAGADYEGMEEYDLLEV